MRVDEISHAPIPSTGTSNEMDEWVVDIEGRLEDPDISHAPRPSMDSDSNDSEEEPSIFGKWECWDDFGASFIPERKKWQLIACMTHWFGLNLQSYLKYMQGKVDRAWSYYHEVDEQYRTAENSKRFIEHLLVSSCFLIFAIVFLSRKRYRKVILNEIDNQNSFPKRLTHKDWGKLVTFLREDPGKKQRYMVTMKYQIPLFVLEAVYTELSNIGKLLDIPIHKLALLTLPKCPRMHPSKEDGGTVPEGGFKHLLHIFHWSRTLDGEYSPFVATNKAIAHFHIPSATELQLSQTVFIKDENGSIDVSYSDDKRLSGVMQLTPWHILQYTSVLFESLVSFEHGMKGEYGFPFTVYIACMACLLKTEADVQILRESGVIPGTTFDDNDVLRCIKELKTFIIGNITMPNELVILEEKVMAYHKKSVHRVIGEFKKRYCSNPWIIISVIAGILLFVLTFIQTIYGTLSYYKQ